MLRGSDGVGSRGRGRQVPVSLGLQDLCLFNLCLLASWFSLSCSPPPPPPPPPPCASLLPRQRTCACVCACVCVRVCARAHVCACVRARACAHARAAAWLTHTACAKVLSDPILVRRGPGTWGMAMVSPLVPGPTEAQVGPHTHPPCVCLHGCPPGRLLARHAARVTLIDTHVFERHATRVLCVSERHACCVSERHACRSASYPLTRCPQ